VTNMPGEAFTLLVLFEDGTSTNETFETDTDGNFSGTAKVALSSDETVDAVILYAGTDTSATPLAQQTSLGLDCGKQAPKDCPSGSTAKFEVDENGVTTAGEFTNIDITATGDAGSVEMTNNEGFNVSVWVKTGQTDEGQVLGPYDIEAGGSRTIDIDKGISALGVVCPGTGEPGFPPFTLPNENQPPSADFSFSPSEPEPGETVSFDGSTSTDSDGTIAKYRWDFDGDGSVDETTSGPTTTHAFSTAGDHAIQLTVEDNNGATNSTTQTVSVNDEPSQRIRGM